MKIAQIVISKTKAGDWKIAVMSLKQTEEVEIFVATSDAIREIGIRMIGDDWERPPLP